MRVATQKNMPILNTPKTVGFPFGFPLATERRSTIFRGPYMCALLLLLGPSHGHRLSFRRGKFNIWEGIPHSNVHDGHIDLCFEGSPFLWSVFQGERKGKATHFWTCRELAWCFLRIITSQAKRLKSCPWRSPMMA